MALSILRGITSTHQVRIESESLVNSPPCLPHSVPLCVVFQPPSFFHRSYSGFDAWSSAFAAALSPSKATKIPGLEITLGLPSVDNDPIKRPYPMLFVFQTGSYSFSSGFRHLHDDSNTYGRPQSDYRNQSTNHRDRRCTCG